jgi:hypothetical protein
MGPPQNLTDEVFWLKYGCSLALRPQSAWFSLPPSAGFPPSHRPRTSRIGFDNIQKKYVTFWIDNSSTAFFLLSGTYDAAKNAWTDTGQWADPMGGTTPVRSVTRIVGPDEYIYEMYMGMPDGKEFKSLENHCTRKK